MYDHDIYEILSIQVKDSLDIYSNLVDPAGFDETSITNKNNFTDVVPSFIQSLAYESQQSAEDLEIAKNLTYLKTKCDDFDDTVSVTLTGTEMVNFGSNLQSKYQIWNCTSDEVCNGLCLGVTKVSLI